MGDITDQATLDLLRKIILDPEGDQFGDDVLEEVLKDSGSVYFTAAVVWNMVASKKEYLEFYFGSFHSGDFQEFSEQAIEISERYSEIAESGEEAMAIDEAVPTNWEDFDVDRKLSSMT